jgi:hypothetical protein
LSAALAVLMSASLTIFEVDCGGLVMPGENEVRKKWDGVDVSVDLIWNENVLYKGGLGDLGGPVRSLITSQVAQLL